MDNGSRGTMKPRADEDSTNYGNRQRRFLRNGGASRVESPLGTIYSSGRQLSCISENGYELPEMECAAAIRTFDAGAPLVEEGYQTKWFDRSNQVVQTFCINSRNQLQ